MSAKLKPLRLPPKDPASLELVDETLAKSGWWRLHFPGRAVRFTLNEEHRFSHPLGRYPVLYAASDEETAAMEVYGDVFFARRTRVAVARSEWEARVFSRLRLPSVAVANLTFAGMAAAKVDASALMHRSRRVTHQWGRAVMDHPSGFHGLLYASRFTGRMCVALFEVPGDAAPRVEGPAHPLARTSLARTLIKRFGVGLT